MIDGNLAALNEYLDQCDKWDREKEEEERLEDTENADMERTMRYWE